MNRIRKAILAFAIFGFFGGCEAVNNRNVLGIRCEASPTIRYQGDRCIVDVDGNGQHIKLKNTSGTEIPGSELFAYDNQYNDLIKLFISKNEHISTENELCKEMLRFFLLNDNDTLKDKYGISETQNVHLFNQRNNVRALFLWHIAKHYVNCDKRKSGGGVHTVVLLDENCKQYHEIKLGNLTLESGKVTALVNLLSDVIENCNFKFRDRSIVFTGGSVNIKNIKSLQDKKCTLYPINPETKEIIFSKPKKKNIEITNAFFRFKLDHFIDLGNFDIDRYNDIKEDGDCGTFYMIGG